MRLRHKFMAQVESTNPCPLCGWLPPIVRGETTLDEFLIMAIEHFSEVHPKAAGALREAWDLAMKRMKADYN